MNFPTTGREVAEAPTWKFGTNGPANPAAERKSADTVTLTKALKAEGGVFEIGTDLEILSVAWFSDRWIVFRRGYADDHRMGAEPL